MLSEHILMICGAYVLLYNTLNKTLQTVLHLSQ
jgi:hypothetical protein